MSLTTSINIVFTIHFNHPHNIFLVKLVTYSFGGYTYKTHLANNKHIWILIQKQQIQIEIHIKMNLGKSHNYRIDPLECTSLQIQIQKENVNTNTNRNTEDKVNTNTNTERKSEYEYKHSCYSWPWVLSCVVVVPTRGLFHLGSGIYQPKMYLRSGRISTKNKYLEPGDYDINQNITWKYQPQIHLYVFWVSTDVLLAVK